MKKYLVIILAVTAAIMITSCSSVYVNKDAQKAVARMKQETPVMKIESETEPELQPDSTAASEGTQEEGNDSGKDAEVTKSNKVMYITSQVHVRAADSTDSKSFGMLDKGSQVTVTGQSDNGWMRIDYKGKEGFVSNAYVSDTKPNAEASEKAPSSANVQSKGKQNGSAAKKPAKGGAAKAAAGTTQAGKGSGASAKPSESSVSETETIIPTVEPSPFTSRPNNGKQDAGGPGTVIGPAGKSGGSSKPEHEIGPGV